jgi:hypothetical protein
LKSSLGGGGKASATASHFLHWNLREESQFMPNESGPSQGLTEGILTDLAVGGYESLFEQIGRMREESSLSKQSGDPFQLMQREESLRGATYDGPTGLLRYLFHKSDADAASTDFADADLAERKADKGQISTQQIIANINDFRAKYDQSRFEAELAQSPSPMAAETLRVGREYNQAVEEAETLGQKSLSSFGRQFQTPADLQRAVNEMKSNAGIARDAELGRIQNEKRASQVEDAGHLKSLELQAARDTTGAKRQNLVNQLDADFFASPPQDWEAGQRYDHIRKLALSNFDADAARKKKLDTAESQDQILGFQEETTEANLRGQGKGWDADFAAMKFKTDQRVRSFRERAAAEGDADKKKQLNREADAAAAAGKADVDAMVKEHQRDLSKSAADNAKKQSANGNSNGPDARGGASGDARQSSELISHVQHISGNVDRLAERTRSDSAVHQDGSATEESRFAHNWDQLFGRAKAAGRPDRASAADMLREEEVGSQLGGKAADGLRELIEQVKLLTQMNHERAESEKSVRTPQRALRVQGEASFFSDPAEIRRQFEMRNIQAATMAGLLSNPDASHGIRPQPGATPDADHGRLVEAIAKIEKFLSRGLTLAMLKD